MKFAGELRCKDTGKLIKWNKGDVIDGVYEEFLPDTYDIVKETTTAKPKAKPATTKAKGTR